MTRPSIRMLLGGLIVLALLGAYAIAAKNGPQGGPDQPAAAFGH